MNKKISEDRFSTEKEVWYKHVRGDEDYVCPHCGEIMLKSFYYGDYLHKHCYYCGGKLSWKNVCEYEDLTRRSPYCSYEDTDCRCKWNGGYCQGSENCSRILASSDLSRYAGRLTYYEKKKLVAEFEERVRNEYNKKGAK